MANLLLGKRRLSRQVPDLELSLEILLQNRHLQRDTAVICEQHADELVTDMQVG